MKNNEEFKSAILESPETTARIFKDQGGVRVVQYDKYNDKKNTVYLTTEDLAMMLRELDSTPLPLNEGDGSYIP